MQEGHPRTEGYLATAVLYYEEAIGCGTTADKASRATAGKSFNVIHFAF